VISRRVQQQNKSKDFPSVQKRIRKSLHLVKSQRDDIAVTGLEKEGAGLSKNQKTVARPLDHKKHGMRKGGVVVGLSGGTRKVERKNGSFQLNSPDPSASRVGGSERTQRKFRTRKRTAYDPGDVRKKPTAPRRGN